MAETAKEEKISSSGKMSLTSTTLTAMSSTERFKAIYTSTRRGLMRTIIGLDE